ncbi:putative HAF family extracellular repeat protein [Catenulispora sp. GP43]|uniref:hypothetical protein n=1 Tax=Catenulispora sp. GP43 TaxID=3156263 RepID=UPI00351166E1
MTRAHLRRILAVAALIAGPASAAPAQAATTPHYKLTVVGGAGTELFGITKTGDVFGVSIEKGAITQEGFLLPAGATRMVFLGSPGDAANADSAANPEAINDHDAVVGAATSFATGNEAAVEWADGSVPTDIGAAVGLQNLVASPALTSINDNGLSTGFGSFHGDVGFTISGGKVTKLAALPNGGVDVEPIAVNDAGLIVGQADTSTSVFQAAAWQNGAVRTLGQLPGSVTSEALAVNASGQAVGADVEQADTDAHAVLFANGTATDLDVPGTGGGDAAANAINDSGVIVGQGGNGHAFVYQNGQAADLNALIPAGSGFTLDTADGIDDDGVIVGTASNASGQTFGFELTPVG